MITESMVSLVLIHYNVTVLSEFVFGIQVKTEGLCFLVKASGMAMSMES
jgi:hypothetical protein